MRKLILRSGIALFLIAAASGGYLFTGLAPGSYFVKVHL